MYADRWSCEKISNSNCENQHAIFKGTVKALCMENPVQELIVGNVSGAKGVEACYEAEVTEQSEVIYDKHEVEGETP